MLHVLFFSDRQVQARLFSLVERTAGLVLVTAVRQPAGSPPVEAREPFATLERTVGALLTQVVVADEGTPEGMWRDPVTRLADHLLPRDAHAAYAAATGYLLLQEGRPRLTVRKTGRGSEDVGWLQEALASLEPRIPRPAGRPGARPAGPPPAAPPPATPPPPAVQDAWALLGIARGTPRAEARRLFHARVAQYHPDKVAHLAEEFRTLAEERTRALLAAWEEVERELPP